MASPSLVSVVNRFFNQSLFCLFAKFFVADVVSPVDLENCSLAGVNVCGKKHYLKLSGAVKVTH